MQDLDPFEIAVLKVMHSRSVYGTHHKKIETIMKSGFPKHELKNIKNAIYSLIKKGFIVWYNKSKKDIQLNKNKAEEIVEIIISTLER